jgi:hypothetical protein
MPDAIECWLAMPIITPHLPLNSPAMARFPLFLRFVSFLIVQLGGQIKTQLNVDRENCRLAKCPE